MEYQRQIGADLLMAFDECTYYPATHEYAEKAMMRTHKWLMCCIDHKNKNLSSGRFCRRFFSTSARLASNSPDLRAVGSPGISATYQSSNQYLFGIIQGGTFKDLRIASAKFISEQDVSGVAIGGYRWETKEEMRQQVKWVAPYLPANKPVHLLGVGQIDDIIDLVKYGIDTFDCVEPTRLARMGTIYQLMTNKNPQINKSISNFKLRK